MSVAQCGLCDWRSKPSEEVVVLLSALTKHCRRNHPCAWEGCEEPGLLGAHFQVTEENGEERQERQTFCSEPHAQRYAYQRFGSDITLEEEEQQHETQR